MARDVPRWAAPLVAPARRPAAVLLIAVGLAILSLWSISRSRSSSSIQDLLGKHNPAAVALASVLDHFPSAEELLVLITLDDPAPLPATPAGGSSAHTQNSEEGVNRLLAAAMEISKALLESPSTAALCRHASYTLSPQIMEFITREAVPSGLMYLSEQEFHEFLNRLTPESMREQIRQNQTMISAPGAAGGALSAVLIKDPLRLREFMSSHLRQQGSAFRTRDGQPEFVSSDGKSVLLRVAGARPPSDLDFAKLITARAHEVIRAINVRGVRVDLAGAYAIAAASERAIRADLKSSIMWSVVIMQAAFLLAYRNVLSFPIAFFPVALGLLIAFGIHSLVTSGFTPLTAAIGAMLVGCGIDYPVYFVSYFEAARTRGMTLPAARDDTVISLATPLLAGCATSIVGFLAIATSRIQALRDFAFLGGLGLALALAGTIWILPATLTLAARAGWLGRAGPRLRVGGLVRLACANPRTSIGICVATAAISAASLSFTHGVRFESDLNVMHPAPNAPLETQRIIANKFGSADSMIVYIEAGSDAELVSAAYRVQQALRSPNAAASGVAESFGLPALLPDPSRASARAAQMAAIDAGQVIADFDSALSDSIFDTAAFAQYREFLQRLLTDSTAPTIETLSGYADLYNMLVAPADNGRRSSVVLLTLARDETDARARDATVTEIRHALDPIPQATLTGLGVVGYDVEHSVRRDVPLVVTLASGAVILLLLVSLRSLRDTGLTLIPVAFGVLCLLGYMSIAGERFNLANTVAMPLLIGVGVDYGIFMVSMARQARLAGDGPEGAISRLAASLHAILLSATTNIVGFGSLAFTSTPAVQSLGRAISVGIVACVAGTLLMLTPILTLHDRSDGPAGRPE